MQARLVALVAASVAAGAVAASASAVSFSRTCQLTTQSVRVGTQEIVIAPSEAEDGSFVASLRGGRRAEQTFEPADWADPRVRLDAARAICESFAITRNNQNLTKVAKAINDALA